MNTCGIILTEWKTARDCGEKSSGDAFLQRPWSSGEPLAHIEVTFSLDCMYMQWSKVPSSQIPTGDSGVEDGAV